MKYRELVELLEDIGNSQSLSRSTTEFRELLQEFNNYMIEKFKSQTIDINAKNYIDNEVSKDIVNAFRPAYEMYRKTVSPELEPLPQ